MSVGRLVVMTKEHRHLLIDLAEARLDRSQFLQRELHESPINGMEIRGRTERVALLVGRRPVVPFEPRASSAQRSNRRGD
jgi:hypothetical protein